MYIAKIITRACLEDEYCQVEFDRSIWDHDWRMSVKEGRSIKEVYQSPLPLKMKKDRGSELTDFIGNTSKILIVSKKVKDVIQSYVSNKAEYLPVEIIGKDNKIASKDYYLINPLNSYDCLDKEHSVFHEDDEYGILGVKKYAFSTELLSNVPDVFRVPQEPTVYFFKNPIFFNELKELALTNTDMDMFESI